MHLFPAVSPPLACITCWKFGSKPATPALLAAACNRMLPSSERRANRWLSPPAYLMAMTSCLKGLSCPRPLLSSRGQQHLQPMNQSRKRSFQRQRILVRLSRLTARQANGKKSAPTESTAWTLKAEKANRREEIGNPRLLNSRPGH